MSKPFKQFCSILLCYLACVAFVGNSQGAALKATIFLNPKLVPQTSQNEPAVPELVVPLIVESTEWTSILTIVNESTGQVHAQISLQSSDDLSLIISPRALVLPGHSSRRFAVNSLFNQALPDFIGSLAIKVLEPEAAKNMAVVAQATLIGQAKLAGESVDEEVEIPTTGSDFKSVVNGSSALMAIKNSGADAASAQVTCIEGGATSQKTVQIPAYAFRVLNGCESPNEDSASATNVMSRFIARLRIAKSSTPSAYRVNGGPSRLSVFGLTASLEHGPPRITSAIFVKQSDFTSRTTVFAGFPIGSYPGLPGKNFVAHLTLANLSNASHVAIVRGTLSETMSAPRVLSTVDLHPFEVKRIDVPFHSNASALFGTVMIDQEGDPGDVIASLYDRDDEASLSPLPRFLHHVNNGGGHPWSIEPGASSTLIIFNASAKAQTLNLSLGADGTIWQKTKIVQSNETVSLNIKEIIESINRESPGKKVTPMQGEISWFTLDQADVFGRVLIAHDQEGRTSLESYSCGYNIVLCSLNMNNSFAAIDYLATGSLGPLSPQFCTSFAPTECYGTQYGAGSASSYTWQSIDSSITPISGSSSQQSVNLYGQALGSGGATGFANAGSCQQSSGGGAQVLALSCSPSTLVRGGSTTCTIQGGSGVTGSNWTFTPTISGPPKVTGPDGTSWSGTMVTSGTISASASFDGATTSVSAVVTVNARSGFTVSAPSMPTAPSPNGTYPMDTLVSPPSGAEGSYGESGFNSDYSYENADISGGPNSGYAYIASFTDKSTFIYELNPGLLNSSDPFYLHQYGNCGIPSVSQIVTAVQAHEYASTPSHYSEFLAAWNANNPGVAAESVIGDTATVGGNLAKALTPVYQSASSAANVEPPTNLPANINHPPYTTCP